MNNLAWAAALSLVLHNAIVFYFQKKYIGDPSFTKAWFSYMKGDLLAEGRDVFLIPTISLVITITLCATILISILITGSG